MSKKKRSFTNEFKTEAVNYVASHPELTLAGAAKNLGVSLSALNRWRKEAEQSEAGTVNMVGTGNYRNEEAKEIARLRRELRDTQDALEILKKAISILGD